MSCPGFNGLGVTMFRRLGGKGSVAELMNDKGVLEQPRLHTGSVRYLLQFLDDETLWKPTEASFQWLSDGFVNKYG